MEPTPPETTTLPQRDENEPAALVRATPPPEKRTLWSRLAVLGGRREGGAGDRLELIATRLQVVEEQLRELGVALDRGGAVANATATELTDRIAKEMGRIERRLAALEESGSAAQLERMLDERLGKLEERTNSQLERVEQKLTQVWEIEEQVAQLPEVLDRLADLRDAQLDMRAAARSQSRAIVVVGLVAAASLVLLGVATLAPLL